MDILFTLLPLIILSLPTIAIIIAVIYAFKKHKQSQENILNEINAIKEEIKNLKENSK